MSKCMLPTPWRQHLSPNDAVGGAPAVSPPVATSPADAASQAALVVASSVTPSPRGATGPVRNSGAPATPLRGATRGTDHAKRRWPWITLAAIGAALLLWFVARPMYLGPVIIPSTVVRADFVQTVVASGHVETPFACPLAVR